VDSVAHRSFAAFVAAMVVFGPASLRLLDPVLPLGIAASALRNTVYLGGHDTSGQLRVLAAWAAAGVAFLTFLTPARQSRSPTP
jgi:hypothetical protein